MTFEGEVNDFLGIFANDHDNIHLIKINKEKKEEAKPQDAQEVDKTEKDE